MVDLDELRGPQDTSACQPVRALSSLFVCPASCCKDLIQAINETP